MYQWVPDPRLKDLPASRPEEHAKERLDYLLKHLKGKTVLDIGCSEGYFTTELAKRGYEVTAVDINPDLVSIARYLTAIQGATADFYVGKWQNILKEKPFFDNIIYFSVLHNQINADGLEKAYTDLELFRGKADQIFVEIPDIAVQPDWTKTFRVDVFDDNLQWRTKMNIADRWSGYRPILLLNNDKKAEGTRDNRLEEEIKSFTTYDVKDVGPMYLSDKDYVTSTIFATGKWEPRTTDFVKNHLKVRMTFVDIGSQFGYYSLLASKRGARVHTFEPLTTNREYLEGNIKLNNLRNITVYKAALSNTSGEAKLYRGNTPGQTSLTQSKHTQSEYETVDLVKFDSLGIAVPDMIKIDVEGHEKQVLEGMASVLTTTKPIYIILEDKTHTVADWLVDEWGFNRITTERAYDNEIVSKNIKTKYIEEPLRIHLLGPFNTPTTLADEGLGNAFASKVVRVAKILKRLGHYVIFYGVEGSDVECDEFVEVSTKDVLEKTYGKWEKNKVYGYGYHDYAHRHFNSNAIVEIRKRQQYRDFLLCCYGVNQKEIADAVGIPETMEIGIGYTGSFAKYKVFESYFQMNYTYGATQVGDINFYNTVIPGYFDPDDFEYCDKKDDYFLFLGRIVQRKGVGIAKQVCEKIGAKLKVAGFASRDNKWDINAYEDVIKSPNVEYVGFAGLEKRKQLMSKAKAVLMPTTYLEPFGYVAIEAMMSGTPVITTDGGAFSETICDHYTGFRCNTFDDFVWAAKHIDEIKPENCRKWATENYSMERATKMYKEYFTRILNLYGKGWYAMGDENDTENRDRLKLWYPQSVV